MAELVPKPKFLRFYKRKNLTEKNVRFYMPQTIFLNR